LHSFFTASTHKLWAIFVDGSASSGYVPLS